jgi:uncharacterized protein YbjT (DUF2867 family)
MILVTGATGNVGSQVVRGLEERGEAVRAFVRDETRARSLLGGEVELAIGDFDDPSSLRDALRGIEAVFLSSADGPRKVEQETAVIEAAGRAGVRRIVKCSTVLAQAGSVLPPFDWHGRVEEQLLASGIPSVVLRSSFFTTNLLAAAGAVRATGALVAPAGNGHVAMIDPRDTAAVAAAVLTEPRHDGRTYELTGPEAVTYADVAAALSRATGSRIEYVDVPDAVAAEEIAASGLPGWLAAHLAALFPLIREDALASTTRTVRELTGREPRSVADFAHHHADAFRQTVLAGQR